MRSPPDWWKKWKPLRWLAGLGLIAAFSAAISPYFISTEIEAPKDAPDEYHFTMPTGQPLALLDSFHSYDKIETVQEALSAAGYTAQLLRNHKPHSSKYPPRDLDSLIVVQYRHLGVDGRLDLNFYNGYLFQAVFDVSKAEPYAAALESAEPALKRSKLGTAEAVDGKRRVLTNVYYSAGPVGRAAGSSGWVMWQDLKLVKLRDEWEAQFGLITP